MCPKIGENPPKTDGENFMVPNPIKNGMIFEGFPIFLVQHPSRLNRMLNRIPWIPVGSPLRMFLMSNECGQFQIDPVAKAPGQGCKWPG